VTNLDTTGEPREVPLIDVLGLEVTPARAALAFLAARRAVADLELRSLDDLAMLTDEQAAARVASLDLSVRLFWARWVQSSWSARSVWLTDAERDSVLSTRLATCLRDEPGDNEREAAI
jgi:hypothetical protein